MGRDRFLKLITLPPRSHHFVYVDVIVVGQVPPFFLVKRQNAILKLLVVGGSINCLFVNDHGAII